MGEKIVTTCKKFQKKYDRSFPLSIHGRKMRTLIIKKRVSSKWHSYFNSVMKNRIGLEAYITLTVDRITNL